MVDPRRVAVLVTPKGGGEPEDKTRDVVDYRWLDDGRISVQFSSRREPYFYPRGRVLVLRDPRPVRLPRGARVEVDRVTWQSVTEMIAFEGADEELYRVFYPLADGREVFKTYPSSRVRMVQDAGRTSAAHEVWSYLRSVVARLPPDDDLRRVYGCLDFVHPESALARYLSAAPLQAREPLSPLVFPFRRNLSQWRAVERAVASPFSVIEGPSGTGKTETILNLVATVVSAGATVGVVSLNNAAVDNVREKLDEAGFGHLVAALGNREKREAFFAQRGPDEGSVRMPASAPPGATDRLRELDEQLRALYTQEREAAELRGH
jgi:hypothetical protein